MTQSLVFNNIEVNKKDFYVCKKASPLNLVDVKRVKNNNDTFKYFIGYLHDDYIIKPLCVILPQLSEYIKYFEIGGKSMPFKIEDEDAYLKYNEIWNKIKSILNVRLHRPPIYDEKYIKTKAKIFNSMINTLFSGDEILKKIHYVCIAAVCIDSILRVDKKIYPRV